MQISFTPSQLSNTLNRLLLSPDAVGQITNGISYISLVQDLTEVVAMHCGGAFNHIDASGDDLLINVDSQNFTAWMPAQLMVETYRIAVLSSRHLSPKAVAGFNDLTSSASPVVSRVGYGWLLRVNESTRVDPWQSSFDDIRFPCDALQHLAMYLMDAGYTAFEFRPDAPVIPGFPVFVKLEEGDYTQFEEGGFENECCERGG